MCPRSQEHGEETAVRLSPGRVISHLPSPMSALTLWQKPLRNLKKKKRKKGLIVEKILYPELKKSVNTDLLL